MIYEPKDGTTFDTAEGVARRVADGGPVGGSGPAPEQGVHQ